MRAYEIRDHFGLDALTPCERPVPEPGHGEVRIRLRAVSLNYRDLLIIKGQYNPKMPLPRVPVSDGAGVVDAIGPGVTRWKVGDRVSPLFMPAWLDGGYTPEVARSALGGGVDGLLAEQAVLPESGVIGVPAHLSDEEAATLPCAALTAWHALFPSSNLKPGEVVLTQGTGGVSLFALQLARLAGARVIITSSSDEKLARAKTLGASDGINYRTTPDWDRAVLDMTGGTGVDHVIELGGAGTLPNSLKAVRMGGMINLIGVLTGVGAESNPMPILMKAVRVQGIFVGHRAMFEAMNRAISLNGLMPVVDRVFPFDRAREALAYMESGAHMGKIVIRF
jgi:NADPH:quinone reductase-like Zn-dependent oxidoreductase